MGVLPGIFFDVHLFDSDLLLFTFDLDFNPAVVGDWRRRLGNLVGLWVIRVEVVLPVKVHPPCDLGMECQAGHNSITDNALVQRWQYPGVPPVNNVSIGVRLVTIFDR